MNKEVTHQTMGTDDSPGVYFHLVGFHHSCLVLVIVCDFNLRSSTFKGSQTTEPNNIGVPRHLEENLVLTIIFFLSQMR